MEEEYKMLREEIMFNLTKMHGYVSIVSTVAVALLTYVLQNCNDNIALISLFLATLVLIEGRIYAVTKGNLRISTYMEVLLEPFIEHRNYETYSYTKLNDRRSHNIRKVKESVVIDFILGINIACFLIGLIPCAFNCTILMNNISFTNILFSALNVVFMISLLLMVFIYKGGKRR